MIKWGTEKETNSLYTYSDSKISTLYIFNLKKSVKLSEGVTN